MSIEQFGYKQELKRSLTFWDLLVYGMIFMIPIAPFGFLGYMLSDSSGMIVLVYAIGAIAMIFTVQSYGTMAGEFPLAGSVYSYASRGINESLGFLAGWAILLDYIMVPSLIYLVSTFAISNLVSIPTWVYLVGLIVINTFLNIRGIEFTTRANIIILIIQFIILGIFFILGTVALLKGVGNTSFTITPLYDSSKFNFNFIMGGVTLAVLSFLGFDGMTTFSEEVKGGSKTVGKAAVFSLIIIGALFIVQSWIAADLIKGIQGKINPDFAIYQVLELLGGGWLKMLASLGLLLSWGLACALSYQAAISRIFFSMGRDRKLPAVLAKIHPKYRTPYVGVYLMAVVSLVVSLLFQNHVDLLSNIVSFGAMIAFIAVHLSVINHFIIRKKSKQYFKHLISPIIGLVIICSVIINMDHMALAWGFSWLFVGLVVLFLNKKFNFFNRLQKKVVVQSENFKNMTE